MMNVSMDSTNLTNIQSQQATRDIAKIVSEKEPEKVQSYGEKVSEVRVKEDPEKAAEAKKAQEVTAKENAAQKETVESIAKVREDAGLMSEAIASAFGDQDMAEAVKAAPVMVVDTDPMKDPQEDQLVKTPEKPETYVEKQEMESEEETPVESKEQEALKQMAERYNNMIDSNEGSTNPRVSQFIKSTRELIDANKEELASKGIELDETGHMQVKTPKIAPQAKSVGRSVQAGGIEKGAELSNPEKTVGAEAAALMSGDVTRAKEAQTEADTAAGVINDRPDGRRMALKFENQDGRVLEEDQGKTIDAVEQLKERMYAIGHDIQQLVPDRYMGYNQNQEAEIHLQAGSYFNQQT